MTAMAPSSRPRTAGVWEIPTNEELMIARHTAAITSATVQRERVYEDAAVGRNAFSS
jgi:hypothetical protein